MVRFLGKSIDFLPSPIVARSASGSNSRLFLATALGLIISNFSPKVAQTRHNHPSQKAILTSAGSEPFCSVFLYRMSGPRMAQRRQPSVKPDGLAALGPAACPNKAPGRCRKEDRHASGRVT